MRSSSMEGFEKTSWTGEQAMRSYMFSLFNSFSRFFFCFVLYL